MPEVLLVCIALYALHELTRERKTMTAETRVKRPLVIFCNTAERQIAGCTVARDDHWYPGACIEVRRVVNGNWEFAHRWVQDLDVTDADILKAAGIETGIHGIDTGLRDYRP